MMKKILFILFIFLINFYCYSKNNESFSVEGNQEKIKFVTSGSVFEINLNTLEIWGSKNNSCKNLLADTPNPLGKVTNFKMTDKSAKWYYPDNDLQLTITLENQRLVLEFSTNTEQTLIFPRVGRDEHYKAIIYPEGEGLFVPLSDPFWQNELQNVAMNTHGELSMPFFGYYAGSNTISYILHDDLHNQLIFLTDKNKKLYTQLTHQFKLEKNHIANHIPSFTMSIAINDSSPISPAIEYKNYLLQKGQLVTLKEKIASNKNVEKLLGALHIYLWGNGRSPEILDKFQSLGIHHLWLGYDQDQRSQPLLITPEFIEKAIRLGYLIGPYDSFHTMENPKSAGSINNIYEGLYPKACIINDDGKRNIGFAGKGCHLSSEALKLQSPENQSIYHRINEFIRTGINSYFLDCDATGELFDDYSPHHPMTKMKDRLNRLERMRYIGEQKKLVLGSESTAAWAVPMLAFAHGNFAVHNAVHWKLTKSKQYGGWWPEARPAFFFLPIHVDSNYIKAKYDPRYRLPLFQTVFHDCIITTDRWEISHMKIKNAIPQRELLELLYGIPSIWALDRQDLEKYGHHIQKLYHFFEPLHKVIATEPLKSFQWLDDDHLVQQIIYGDKARITANFSAELFQDIPKNTIAVEWMEGVKHNSSNNKVFYSP